MEVYADAAGQFPYHPDRTVRMPDETIIAPAFPDPEISDYQEIIQLFQATPSDYWTTHYRFDHPVSPQQKNLGKDAASILIINTVVPFLYAYGKARHIPHLVERAVHFLENTEPENNTIITSWKKLGITALHAAHSHGLAIAQTTLLLSKKMPGLWYWSSYFKQHSLNSEYERFYQILS